jgi:hypothetical protein
MALRVSQFLIVYLDTKYLTSAPQAARLTSGGLALTRL